MEAYHNGVPVDLGRRRGERCLLGLLLLEAGRVLPVDRLAALLWDDEPPDHARATLQTHVSRLRARLDPGRPGRAARSRCGAARRWPTSHPNGSGTGSAPA